MARAAFRSFQDARAYVRTTGLASEAQWRAWCRRGERPPDIPSHPEATYRDHGWQGWADWFETQARAPYQYRFRPFTQARAYVRALGLRTVVDWRTWRKSAARPADIPANPARAYAGRGWAGYHDWLGSIGK